MEYQTSPEPLNLILAPLSRGKMKSFLSLYFIQRSWIQPPIGFLEGLVKKKIYCGRIFIYVYPETLSLKYDSLDNSVPNFQLFAKINFDAVCMIAQKTKKAVCLTGEKLSLQI